MRKMGEFKTQISQKDESLFDNSILILKNVDFHELWNLITYLEINWVIIMGVPIVMEGSYFRLEV